MNSSFMPYFLCLIRKTGKNCKIEAEGLKRIKIEAPSETLPQNGT